MKTDPVMHQASRRKPGLVSDRKKQLIAQGVLYRAEILASRETLQESLQPESLARRILQRSMHVAIAAFNGGFAGKSGQPGLPLQAFLPLLMRGASAVVKRKGLRPVLRGVVVATALAGIGAFAFRGRKRMASDSHASN